MGKLGGPLVDAATSDGDEWAQWSAARAPTLNHVTERRASLDNAIDALERGHDHGEEAARRWQSFHNDRDILDVDARTAFPARLSDSGSFELGDFRAYLRERASQGGDVDAFDQMSPERQASYIRDLRATYEAERAQEAARRDGRSRLAGTAGEALGETLAFATTPPWIGPNVRASARSGQSACGSCAPEQRRAAEPHARTARGPAVDPVTARVMAQHGLTLDSTLYRITPREYLNADGTVSGNPKPTALVTDPYNPVPNPMVDATRASVARGEASRAELLAVTQSVPASVAPQRWARDVGTGLNVARRDPSMYGSGNANEVVIAIKVRDVVAAGGRIYPDAGAVAREIGPLYVTFDNPIPYAIAR